MQGLAGSWTKDPHERVHPTGAARRSEKTMAAQRARATDVAPSLEEQSHNIATGMEYLPGIACRPIHCRNFGGPSDFLMWFQFEADHAEPLAELVRRLRATEEWRYVECEIDIRLSRNPGELTQFGKIAPSATSSWRHTNRSSRSSSSVNP